MKLERSQQIPTFNVTFQEVLGMLLKIKSWGLILYENLCHFEKMGLQESISCCMCISVCLSVCLTAVKEKQCIPGYRMFPKLAIGVPGKPGTSMRLWELGEVRATNKSLKDKLVFFTSISRHLKKKAFVFLKNDVFSKAFIYIYICTHTKHTCIIQIYVHSTYIYIICMY